MAYAVCLSIRNSDLRQTHISLGGSRERNRPGASKSALKYPLIDTLKAAPEKTEVLSGQTRKVVLVSRQTKPIYKFCQRKRYRGGPKPKKWRFEVLDDGCVRACKNNSYISPLPAEGTADCRAPRSGGSKFLLVLC